MSITAPHQERFRLGVKPDSRRLMSLVTAAQFVGDDTDASDILDDLTRGPRDPLRIDWAWNIATRDAEMREIRVLPMSLANRAERYNLRTALFTVFPEQSTLFFAKRVWPATQLAFRFSCDAQHLLNLIDDGSLEAVPGTRRVGRNGSPAVTWSSVMKFFEQRRVV